LVALPSARSDGAQATDVAEPTDTGSAEEAGFPGDGSGGSVELPAIADTYVRDGADSGNNFGLEPYLYAKDSVGLGGYSRESYLKFDITPIGSPRTARLRITAPNSLSTFTIGIWSVADTSWEELGLNWNTKPAVGLPVLSSQLVVAGPRAQYDFDVTAFVQAEVAAGHKIVSFALTSLTHGGAEPIAFSSRESPTDPPLVIAER